MANQYFRKLPSFDYISRLPDAKIGDYIAVKNLFKKAKIRPDIFQNLSYFEKYKIIGDDRPDNVAYKVYEDSTLDWIVLLSNNIVNIQSEWPLTQNSFDTYLREKYGVGLNTEEDIYNNIYNGIHHYETTEVKSTSGTVIVPAGLQVPNGYSVSYFDSLIDQQIDSGNIAVPVTNYEYEDKLQNEKRNIYLLNPRYLNIIINDTESIMEYQKGSSQYVSEDLKRGDNIRLYS